MVSAIRLKVNRQLIRHALFFKKTVLLSMANVLISVNFKSRDIICTPDILIGTVTIVTNGFVQLVEDIKSFSYLAKHCVLAIQVI